MEGNSLPIQAPKQSVDDSMTSTELNPCGFGENTRFDPFWASKTVAEEHDRCVFLSPLLSSSHLPQISALNPRSSQVLTTVLTGLSLYQAAPANYGTGSTLVLFKEK